MLFSALNTSPCASQPSTWLNMANMLRMAHYVISFELCSHTTADISFAHITKHIITIVLVCGCSIHVQSLLVPRSNVLFSNEFLDLANKTLHLWKYSTDSYCFVYGNQQALILTFIVLVSASQTILIL